VAETRALELHGPEPDGPEIRGPEIHGPELHGHRGARALRPENTLPGLAYALGIGVDAIEFDVTLTADDGLILAHDLTVDDTVFGGQTVFAGQTVFGGQEGLDGPLVGRPWRSLTLAEISALDAGDRHPVAPYEETFVAVPGTAVPTLDQVCVLAGPSGVTLSVELKTHPSWPDRDVRLLVSSALTVLAAHGCAGQTRMLGFDWRVLQYAAELAPDLPRVALVEPSTWADGSTWLAGLDPAGYDPATGFVAAARNIGAAFVSPWDGMASPSVVAAAHEAGLGIVVWTINDPEVMSALADLGADGIVTDRPDLMRAVLAQRGCVLPRRHVG
jgi:glycerophosphoryl diester phosphodiesterase